VSDPGSNLSSIPRRFWTEAVARLALDQGDHDLAIEIAKALIADAPPSEKASFDELLEDARAARARALSRDGKARVIERLQACLKRARVLKRQRCAP
jgi:hypothetical protein